MIARRTPLRRSTKPLKRTRLKPVSKKRAKEMRTYAKLRKECLEKQPICEVWLRENGWTCVRLGNDDVDPLYERRPEPNFLQMAWPLGLLGDYGAPPATEIHHREKRGKNYLNAATFMCVSREAHERIHANPSWAREMGFLK